MHQLPDAISAINTIKSVTMGDRARVSGHKTISGLSGRTVRPIALRHILEIAKTPMARTASMLDESRNGLYGKGLEISGIGGIETWKDALEFYYLSPRNQSAFLQLLLAAALLSDLCSN